MHAAVMADRVVNMAREQAAEFGHREYWLRYTKPVLRGIVEWPLRALAGLLDAKCEKLSHSFGKQALWFRGARSALQELSGSGTLQLDQVALESLERMEAGVLQVRQQTLLFAEEVLKHREFPAAQKVHESLKKVASNAADLFEEVRGFRLALLSLEADRSRRTEGLVACSAEEFDAVFDRMLEGK